MGPRVSVALAIHRAHPGLGRAVRCLLGQTGLGDLDIVLVLNSAPTDLPALGASVAEIAAMDARIRVLQTPRASLASALNVALREARFDLVARMDDDDWCPDDRLALQARALNDRPDLLGIACAWQLAGTGGEVRQTLRPPCDAGALRARLLLGNCLAHGSVMLRRKGVLAMGGYDESLDRAQDYDLWLRLSARGQIACMPDVLYRYIADHDAPCSGDAQAIAAAGAMLRAWRGLPAGDDQRVARAIADALISESAGDRARDSLDTILGETPSRDALLARLWLDHSSPPMRRRAIDACRRARLREVGADLRALGARELRLYGAGNHARWILDHEGDLDLPIVGLVDDARMGERLAHHVIEHPSTLARGQCALIASDAFEDEIWQRTLPLRDRGVRIFRLYADDDPADDMLPGGEIPPRRLAS